MYLFFFYNDIFYRYINFAGSRLNVQDSHGLTALMVCCAEDTNHEEEARCVEYLLSHNADITLNDKQVCFIKKASLGKSTVKLK